MPRNGGNTLRSNRRNHKPMHSGAKGKGHDAKLKRAKMMEGEAAHPKPRKREKKNDYEPA